MIKIVPVEKTNESGKLIMDWRNDKETMKNSFRQKEFTWDEFKELFYGKYFSNKLPPLFAIYKNQKIAFIGSMNLEKEDTIEISINIKRYKK